MVENETTINNEEEYNDNKQYIDAINELKTNTVSRDRYNKIVAERDSLIQSLVNGEQLSADNQQQQNVKSAEELTEELRNKKHNLSACDFLEKALEFRQRELEDKGVDCFVSIGYNIQPTENSYQSAEKTAQLYRECLDYANGDSKVLINELQRRMPESSFRPSIGNNNINMSNRRY